jgi:tetratricopeptide (TPR) repeat protein
MEPQTNKPNLNNSSVKKQVLVVWLALLIGSLVIFSAFDFLSPKLMNYLEAKNPRIFYDKAKVLADEQKYPEALDTLQKALVMLPSDAEFLILQGDILEKQGKLDEAYQAFAKAESADSKNWEPPYRMGVVLAKQKNDKKAVEYLQKAAEMKPEERWVFNALGWSAYADNQLDIAYKAFEKASELAPQSPEYPLMMGRILASRNDWSQALPQFQKALAQDSSKAEYFLWAGKAAQKLGDKAAARSYFQQALNLEPANPEARKALSQP